MYVEQFEKWKKLINNLILYRYYSETINQQLETYKEQLKQYQKNHQLNEQDKQGYLKLLKEYGQKSSEINKKILENINNQKLLQQLYKKYNINITEQGFEAFIKSGGHI